MIIQGMILEVMAQYCQELRDVHLPGGVLGKGRDGNLEVEGDHWWNVYGAHDVEVEEYHDPEAADSRHGSSKHLWHHPIVLPYEFLHYDPEGTQSLHPIFLQGARSTLALFLRCPLASAPRRRASGGW